MRRIVIPTLISIIVWECIAFILGKFRFPEFFDFIQYIVSSICADSIIAREGGGTYGFTPHILATIGSFASSMTVGILLGVLLAGFVYGSGFVGQIINWIVRFIGIIPPLIFIPLLLLALGPNQSAVIGSGILFATYSVCLYATESMARIVPQYASAAMIYGASKPQLSSSVYFPAMIPGLIGGLRTTAALTLGIVFVAEYLGSASGLGRTVKYAISYSNVQLLFTAVFWAVLIGVAFDRLLIAVAGRLCRWTNQWKQHL